MNNIIREDSIMKMTSAQAAKLLRQLNEQHKALRGIEEQAKSFCASLDEDIESVRPEYDYTDMQEQLAEVERKIRKLKHTINVFNTTTIIPEFGITIDEMLVYLPQLNTRESKLSKMKGVLPKARENGIFRSGGSVIDYRFANYDIKKVEADYMAVSDELAKAQTALDVVNNTIEFDVEL